MIIIKPAVEFDSDIDGGKILKVLERAGRNCYQSFDRITDDSAPGFIETIMNKGHNSVLDHGFFRGWFTVDRGVSHELVRHRLAAPAQESTRYCNYRNGRFHQQITVIDPFFFKADPAAYKIWADCCENCEEAYFKLLELGRRPEEARTVLPHSLKTSVLITADLREWRHIFQQRCASAAHPQMREVMMPLLETAKEKIPVVFDDIWEVFKK